MEMEEGELLSHLCSLMESGTRECEGNLGKAASSSQSPTLPKALLLELYDVFGDENSSGRRCNLDAAFWNELAEKRVSLSALVGGLTCTMERGGRDGLKAAAVYLGLMLVDNCPLYSLFKPLSFHVLAQCIRSACSPGTVVQQLTQRKGKGKKGKRQALPTQSPTDDMEVDSGLVEGEQEQPSQGEEHVCMASVSVQDIVLVMETLLKSLQILPLKDNPDTLKIIVELAVDLPLLTADMAERDVYAGSSRGGPKARKMPAKSNPGSISILLRNSFCVLRSLLDVCHGDVTETAVTIFRALTPSILCSQAAGSPHQRGQMRAQALQFVSVELLSPEYSHIRPAIVALTRHLCLKAPEKAEVRSLAVEAVVMVAKGLGPFEWSKLGKFVGKLSRGKARHRLFAIDLALALFGKLSDPFGMEMDSEAYVSSPRTCTTEVPDSQTNCHLEENTEDQEPAAADRLPQQENAPEAGASTVNQSWGVSCIEAMLHRCSDKVPTMRGRALGNLGQVIELLTSQIRFRGHLQTLLGFVSPAAASAVGSDKSHERMQAAVDHSETPLLCEYTPVVDEFGVSASPLTPGAGHRDLGSLLRRRCLDEKAVVRKGALFLVKKSVVLSGKPPDEATLHAMGTACADPLVSIRKAALSGLTEVMRKFSSDQKVIAEWLQSVLPLSMDDETSIQDECLDAFEEIVLDRVATISAMPLSSLNSCLQQSREKRKGTVVGEDCRAEPQRMLPPGILDVLKGMADGGAVASCVKRICTGLGKRKRVRPGVALALQNMINASLSKSRRRRYNAAAPRGVWMLLAEVSAFVPKAVGWEFLRTHWQLLDKHEGSKRCGGQDYQEAMSTPYSCSEGVTPGQGDGCGENFVSTAWAADRVHLLQTISNVTSELPEQAIYGLVHELLKHLEAFNMHPAEVAGHVKALSTLCRQLADTQDRADNLMSTWVKKLLSKSGDLLQTYVLRLQNQQNPVHMDSFTTPIARSNMKTRARVPSLRRLSALNNADHLSPSGDPPISAAQLVTVIFTIGAVVLACPSEKPGHIVTSLQALIVPRKVTPGQDQPQGDECTNFFLKGVAPEVTVQVWVTLGKLCLADSSLAKRCIPLFVQELERSESAAVRNNIMIVMTDFCVRYTALVDGYIRNLTKPLQDPCELVRRQAFVLLARLLQRDYVKWRGMIFHRFLLALVDDSDKICQLANFLVGSILKVKSPLLAYSTFVETIFVLNDCNVHPKYSNVVRSSERDRKLFSLRGNGDTMAGKRMHIYTALLRQMAPEQLVNIAYKLRDDIFAAATDGILDISDSCSQCVLEDSLKILASREMRVSNKGNVAASESLDTEDDSSQAAAVVALKGRLVAQMKKDFVQSVVPILTELKRMLESRNSPLLGMLMECLRVFVKDFNNEIDIVDKQLWKEIMYDIKKHEAAKVRGKVASATAAAADMIRGDDEAGCAKQEVAVAKPVQQSDAGPAVCTPVSLRKSHRGGTAGAGREDGDKENAGVSRSSAMKSFSTDRVLRSCSTRRNVSVSAEKGSGQPSPRVTWLDQTPGGKRLESAPTRADASRVLAKTPMNLRSSCNMSHTQVTPSPCLQAQGSRAPDKIAAAAILPASQLRGAVMDAAAAATAATVLKEVASSTATPLKKMAIPRLKPPLSGGSKSTGVHNSKTRAA